MTEWCDTDISLIMKNYVRDLDLKVNEEMGDGDGTCKILD